MVDMETGQAIYKRRLVGAAAADPAAVDVDLDGYLDVIYIGTTSGFLYKVNLSTPLELKSVKLPKGSALPALAADVDAKRLVDPSTAQIRDTDWDPVPIFDTIGRPIFFAPIAFYVSSLNRFVLAFGTGDRENLWGFNGQEGRFYMILDDGFNASQLSTGFLPLDETKFCRNNSSWRFSLLLANWTRACAASTGPVIEALERAIASAARSGPDSRVTTTWPFLIWSARSTATFSMSPSTGLRISTI